MELTSTNSSRINIFTFSPPLVADNNETNDINNTGFGSSISELVEMSGLDLNTSNYLNSDLNIVGVLYFERVIREDTGNYTCTASNGLPQTTNITVQSDSVFLETLGKILVIVYHSFDV